MFWRLFSDTSEDWRRMRLRYGREGKQHMLTKGWVRMRTTVGLLIGVFLFAYGCSGDTTAKKMAFVQRGDAYFADGKYAEAILEFKNTIQLDPEDAQAHYKLGLALLKRGSGPADLQEAFHAIS